MGVYIGIHPLKNLQRCDMATQILPQYPEVATSSFRELQWACDWWKHQYAEAGYQSDVAWKMYGDAIDNEDEPALIESLFEVATIFDEIRRDTWHKWNEVKAQYLAMLN
jgi:hypothetical protein